MKWLVYGNLQQNDLFGNFHLDSDNCNQFKKSEEFNGLGTFSYGLELAGEEVTEYRNIPFKNYSWPIRRLLCKMQLEFETSNPKLCLNRLDSQYKDFYQFVDNNDFDAYMTREIFSYTKEYLEFIQKSFSTRVLWLSFSPGRAPFDGWQDKLSYFTHIFLVDQDGVDLLRKKGYNAYHLPFAMSDFSVSDSPQNKKYPLGFIGTIYPDRMKLLNELRSYDFHFWSGNFERDTQIMYPHLIKNFEGKAWGHQMLYKTAEIDILVNPIHRGYMLGKVDNVSNFRNFECIGVKTFQISEDKPAVRELFDQDEMALYSSIDDLKEKISVYSQDRALRETMLKNAYKRVLDQHLYSHRCKKLLKIIQ
ncbi:MAG: glycosyltransferase [Candidatus Cloacimonetes bacterium]|nr:glycosyltransferase [Candidatus Cloacimonadota bacterium]